MIEKMLTIFLEFPIFTMNIFSILNDHSKRHHCPICKKNFTRKFDLQRHNRIHSGDRRYICVWSGCGKSFMQRSALNIHSRIHTNERPYHCPEFGCNKSFKDVSRRIPNWPQSSESNDLLFRVPLWVATDRLTTTWNHIDVHIVNSLFQEKFSKQHMKKSVNQISLISNLSSFKWFYMLWPNTRNLIIRRIGALVPDIIVLLCLFIVKFLWSRQSSYWARQLWPYLLNIDLLNLSSYIHPM